MKTTMIRGAAIIGALTFGSMANAAVTTTGCATVNQCTLQELYNGASITADDVTFDGFFLDDDLNEVPFDPSLIIVTANSVLDTVSLRFHAQPAFLADDTNFNIEYLLGFDASISGSSREFAEASMVMNSGQTAGVNDFSFMQVGAVMSDANLVDDLVLETFVSRDQGVEDNEETSGDLFDSVGSLTALSVAMDIQGESNDDTIARLGMVTMYFDLSGTPFTNPVPLPGAFAFMGAGLLVMHRMRRKQQPTLG